MYAASLVHPILSQAHKTSMLQADKSEEMGQNSTTAKY